MSWRAGGEKNDPTGMEKKPGSLRRLGRKANRGRAGANSNRNELDHLGGKILIKKRRKRQKSPFTGS